MLRNKQNDIDMSSNKNIPQLRFPEFTGEWEKKNLGKVIDVSKGQQVNRTELTEDTTMFPMLNGGSTPSGYYTKFNTPSDSITISEGGNSCGYINYMKVPFWAGGHCYVVKPLFDINKKFIYHALKYNEPNIMRLRVGSGLPNIQRKTLLNEAYLFYPSEPSEQKKIAEFLSAMDDMIEAQGQRVEALKEKKKGLMQQMFPQKGETTPQLRFPEFTGEWIEKKMGDSFEERIEKNRVDLPLLSLGEEGLFLQSETARKDNSNSDKSKYLRVAIGDIAYNTMRMWQGRCVYSCIEGIVSPAYTVCIPNDNVDSMFHYYLFKTQRMINIFHMHSQGLVSDTLNLKYGAFAKIAYCLPPTLVEQKKIAECLSAMDDVIASETAKLDALKEHKKGLMQQMFPQPTK